MSIQKILDEINIIQTKLLDFLDHEHDDLEEHYQNLNDTIDKFKIYDDKYKLKLLFYLILNISNNHHRELNFFNKIEKILQLFKHKMMKYFSNSELFQVFKCNKRILLFLFEENIITFDNFMLKEIISFDYIKYFSPEIMQFMSKNQVLTNSRDLKKIHENTFLELPLNFYEKRKIGENDDFLCELIRNDSIEELIIYINQNNYPINYIIEKSIYETNSYLIYQTNSLIEYAVFFGSVQIFNYLRLNGVELQSSLWFYAIHSDNEEIHLLEQNNVKMEEIEKLFNESIKCHHIDVSNYIESNYMKSNIIKSIHSLIKPLKYFILLYI